MFSLTSFNEESSICIDNSIIKNSTSGKLFCEKIDQKVNFNIHIGDICKNQKRGKTNCLV